MKASGMHLVRGNRFGRVVKKVQFVTLLGAATLVAVTIPAYIMQARDLASNLAVVAYLLLVVGVGSAAVRPADPGPDAPHSKPRVGHGQQSPTPPWKMLMSLIRRRG